MTEAAEKLKAELAQLSVHERAELAHFLIHLLDDDVNDAWDVELTRRLEEIHNGTASGEPSNRVFTAMSNTSRTNWAKIDAMTDDDIDTSDIPPLQKNFSQRRN